jgi:hypothetical protein
VRSAGMGSTSEQLISSSICECSQATLLEDSSSDGDEVKASVLRRTQCPFPSGRCRQSSGEYAGR